MTASKKPIKLVCTPVKEFLEMDFPDPTPDHPGYDTWKADREFAERKKQPKDKLLH